MFLTLQILFTVLAVLAVAALMPVGIFFGWGYSGFCAFLGILFFVLMRVCKTQNELRELRQGKPTQTGEQPDFIRTPKSNDENENNG